MSLQINNENKIKMSYMANTHAKWRQKSTYASRDNNNNKQKQQHKQTTEEFVWL